MGKIPGKVSVDFKYWEFFHLIEGEVIITNENGESWTIRKGEAAIIPAGIQRYLGYGRTGAQALRHAGFNRTLTRHSQLGPRRYCPTARQS